MGAPAPQFVRVADGVTAQVINRQMLPPSLDILLKRVLVRNDQPVILRGARRECTDGVHDLRPWRSGMWLGAPPSLASRAAQGIVRLALKMCTFCGVVEVRDVSVHVMAGVRSGTQPLRTLNDCLGWYAGKRARGRVHI